MRRPTLIVSWGLLLAAAPSRAQDLPLLTESAATARAGTLVLEIGVEAMRDEPNFLTGLPRDVWAGPMLRLVASPADSVEMDFQVVVRVGQGQDPVFHSTSDWGDVTLRAKWCFRPERPGHPALGARFSVTLPETDAIEGLGPDTLRMSAQLLLSSSLGSGLALHANAGLAIVDEPLGSHSQADFLDYGLALVKRVNSELDLLGEVAGRVGQGAPGSPGADQHGELRLGARFGKGSWRGDTALRYGLAKADGNWGFTAGVTWVIRKRS